ncbi:MAG TPA: hypothetical protein VHF24_12995 [Acidimicrobiales bacterium]|nr:hypothetical protein [Acidimicrobiales bacterium]
MILRPVLLVIAVAAAACSGGDGGPVAGEPGPAVPAGPLVVLVRYGGLAGTNDRVAVDASGQATIISDRSPAPVERALAPADLASLRSALERSQIATLDRNYLDPRAADAYQYDVTYQGVTVTADEGALPATLRPVVDQLVKLLP